MIDHVQDKSKVIFNSIYKSLDIPEFVKTAEFKTSSEDLKPGEFADPVSRIFPINSKADSWLSLAYFNKQAYTLPSFKQPFILNLLEKAANFWNISKEDINKAKVAPIQKTANTIKRDIIQFKDGNEVYDTITINDHFDFDKVASAILEKPRYYTYEMRRNVAEQMLNLNYEIDYPIKQALEKTAGKAISFPKHVKSVLTKRACVYKDVSPQVTKQINDVLIPYLDKQASDKPVENDKLLNMVKILDLTDRLTGLNQKYAGDFNVPEQMIFQTSPSDSEEISDQGCMLGDDTIISKQIIKEKGDIIRKVLKDVWEITDTKTDEDLKDTLETLDSDKATDILNLIQD